ncbi:MAG: hypothetical protein Q9207_008333, partial [Kuettlingeria erythrocarpa]
MAGPSSTSDSSTTASSKPATPSSSPRQQTTSPAQVQHPGQPLPPSLHPQSNTVATLVGSSDAPATPLTKPCEFNSCPAGSPAQGFNASSPRLNY